MDAKVKHMIGQMIIAGFPSPRLDDQVRRLVEDFQVGNFALFARNLLTTEQICALTAELHEYVYEKNGLAAFIACDQEGGVVSRVGVGTALFPGAMSMTASACADPYRTGKNCSAALSTLGIRGNFGPVLDVNIQPMNPIIGTRSYADNTADVIKYGVAMVRGMTEGGTMTAVKHFPGHGNTSSDSHLELPRNGCDPETLRRVEFAPFKEAFDAGADALMTCHVLFEQIDPEHPATLSKKIMTDLLRKEMGFTGVAITDCMAMQAIQRSYGIGPGAVLAVNAGCDILCFSHTYESVSQAVTAIYEAVETGVISVERIQESYDRIVAMKKKYGVLTPPAIDVEHAKRVMQDPEVLAFNRQQSRESMLLQYDNGGLAAMKSGKRVRYFAPESIAVTGAEDAERAPTRLSELAVQRFGGESVVYPMSEFDEATAAAIADPAYDVAVLALYNARLRPSQQAILRALEADGRPLVVLLMGAAYDVPLVKRADALVVAHEYTWLAATSLLDVLETGEFKGRLPVTLPEAL
jgi:beta-N-acetylhexosaminidase